MIAPPSHFPGCPIFLPPTSTDPNVPNPTTNKMILSLTPSLNFLCKLKQGFYCLGKLRSQPCYKKCRDFLIFTLSFLFQMLCILCILALAKVMFLDFVMECVFSLFVRFTFCLCAGAFFCICVSVSFCICVCVSFCICASASFCFCVCMEM